MLFRSQVVEKQKEVEALASSTRSKISSQINAIASAQAEVDGKENTLANQRAVLEELIQEKKRIEAELEAAKLREINASLGEVTGEQISGEEGTQYGASLSTRSKRPEVTGENWPLARITLIISFCPNLGSRIRFMTTAPTASCPAAP